MKRIALFATAAALALAAGAPAFAADAAAAAAGKAADIVRRADDVPAPLGAKRGPVTHTVLIETKELIGQVQDGTTFKYWTFNQKVPGPLLRVRVGDTVDVTLTNPADSTMMHNIDFHAATGPGGGGAVTQAAPGESKRFSFKALNPGLYVYHCATPTVAQHIANGMYGMILVEPEGGLPKVDKEFYVMQGELYTEEELGTKGELTESYTKLVDENPTYVTMNGAYKALTGDRALKAKVGETVRIFFGVGGPNLTSSFHVIGEVFEHAYEHASLETAPLEDIQTVTVAPGGATMVDFKLEVPGNYILVDHALSRLEKGNVGILTVEGPANPEVFKTFSAPAADKAH